MNKRLTYKEAFLELLAEKGGEIVGNDEETKKNIDEIFEILESLEDQETAKDWVASSIKDLTEEEYYFVAKGIRFLRPQAFKESEKPERPETHGTAGEG